VPATVEPRLLSSITSYADLARCRDQGVTELTFDLLASNGLHPRVWAYLCDCERKGLPFPNDADLLALHGFERGAPGNLREYIRLARGLERRRGAHSALIEAATTLSGDGSVSGSVSKMAAQLQQRLTHLGQDANLPDVTFADLEPGFREVRWLWAWRIPRGKLTLLSGDPDVGKSFLTTELAAAVSTGRQLFGDDPREPATVLMLSAEDDPEDTVGPRLRAHGADLTRVRTLRVDEAGKGTDVIDLASGLDELEALIVHRRPALVVVDPVTAFLGKTDTHRDAAVRAALTPVRGLAMRYDVAFVLIRHLTKGPRDRVIYRGGGSIGFSAACRSELMVDYHPDDGPEVEHRRRVLAAVKHNLAPRTPPALVYDLSQGRVTWQGATRLAARDLGGPEVSGEKLTAEREAAEFLIDALYHGERPVKEVEEEARQGHNISQASLDRARRTLGVIAKKRANRDGTTYWGISLPPSRKGSKPSDAKSDTLATLDPLQYATPDSKGGKSGKSGNKLAEQVDPLAPEEDDF
jgi:hypothetical protein